MNIKVEKVSKAFKHFQALNNVSLDVKKGEFMALLGPSGSGKTTLLRIIAGLEVQDSGEIYSNNVLTSEIPIRERGVGFVFQHYALFRHMTVFENIAFGLRVKPSNVRPSKDEIYQRVMELLKLVQLKGMEGQYPSQLSGGQRQRVALARVLAIQPRVMLLDEPFGALDSKVRKELRRWLRKLHDEMHITTLFVTHDQEEAMEIADRVAIMDKGEIVQVGSPEEIWNQPKNAFVYDFLGHYNEFIGERDLDGTIRLCDLPYIPPTIEKREQRIFLKRFKNFFKKTAPSLTPSVENITEKSYIRLYTRPFEIDLSKEKPNDEAIEARVVHINPAGPLVKVELEKKNGDLIQVEKPKEELENLQLKKNDRAWVRPREYKIFE